jgi:predicted AlkP superfamily pyrophosphatase or phosphodiesterase
MRFRFRSLTLLFSITVLLIATHLIAAPKVIIISLDGATPRLVDQYTQSGVINPNEGLGYLQQFGIRANQNLTISPSLTAPGHIAIATGSIASLNDINANGFLLVASPFTAFTISGFGAAIGGYSIDGPAESQNPTAEPVWIQLRANGKTVVTATWPGGDGIDVTVPGIPNSPIIQSFTKRTVDFTVPFGSFGGVGAQGFTLSTGDFSAAPQSTIDQLNAAGHPSFSQVLQKKTDLEAPTVGGVTFHIQTAALDTTNDGTANYDTLVFFDTTNGIKPGPFNLPSTGPAYVKGSDQKFGLFYFEGSSNKAGAGYYVSNLAPDLSTVHIARSSANFIPRNAPVLSAVDDINNNVGFWAPQPDFRIPERLSPGFTNFPDTELEAIYEDLVRLFTDYQTRLALRAIQQNPDADLLMIYFEQPDGSTHQFLLTDQRQPTNFLDANSIGAGQDQAKVARYQSYIGVAYAAANQAVQNVINAVGLGSDGKPNSNIIVTSDHGFEIFHTAVSMSNLLAPLNIPNTKLRFVTSGPALNVYINLMGREPGGIVTPAEYRTLQQQIVNVLSAASDTNTIYTLGAPSVPVFDKIYPRPLPADDNDPTFGRGISEFVGQDSGDVSSILTAGYNFDGVQNPVVNRSGDPVNGSPVLSLPNFYGAHGYDPELENLSAIFFAAGPDIRKGSLTKVNNIGIAPTIDRILEVKPSATVNGRALPITIPRKIKADIVPDLLHLLPTGDKKDDLRILKAVVHVGASLLPALWNDNSHLTSFGKAVFSEERKAVHELIKIDSQIPEIIRATETLTDVDLQLAEIALDESIAANGDDKNIALSRQELQEGLTEFDSGNYEDAIEHFKASWRYAQKAIGK